MKIEQKFLKYLSSKDTVLAGIIEKFDEPSISKSDDYLLDLVKYIIFQQISTKAGISIYKRFLTYYKNEKLLKRKFYITKKAQKEIGLSAQKKLYIENIFLNKEVIIGLKEINDERVIRENLIKIKGIGNWTIDMFLIFSKCHLNIFPVGDLAIINVIKKEYQVDSIEQILKIANKWSPYKTIATLYLWESLGDEFPN